MFGGFWGTPREDAWRRRKEREEQRMSEVRTEEQRVRVNMWASYEAELEQRGQVLQIARGLLGDARHDARAAKRQRREEDGDAVEGTAEAAPPRGKSENGVEPDIATDSSAVGSGADAGADDDERKAEESVRENLLALSYAMFDTLYGTCNFDPRSFVAFLLRQGERALAEEIGLAAVEKSKGNPDIVRFVLDDLVPGSDELERLPRTLEEIMSSNGMKSEGKDVLIQWQVSRGNTEAAFIAALLCENEYKRLNTALPLATTKQRKKDLKDSCSNLLRKEVIGMFDGDEWHGFVSTLLPIHQVPRVYRWRPPFESYISYAASSTENESGKRIAGKMVQQLTREKLKFHDAEELTNPFQSQRRGFQSQRRGRNDNDDRETCMSNLAKIRDDSFDQVMKGLSTLEAVFGDSNGTIQQQLGELGIDRMQIIAAQVAEVLQLPPKSECKTLHGTFRAVFICRKCRIACMSLAIELGVIRALRQHPLTSQSVPFLRIGFACTLDRLVQVATPGQAVELPAIVKTLLKNGMRAEHYCASM